MSNTLLMPVLLAACGACLAVPAGEPSEREFTANFTFQRGDVLVPRGSNAYLTLNPGAFSRLEGEDDNLHVAVEITVLSETKAIRVPAEDGMLILRTRVVEEWEWIDGELAQISRQYLARCPNSGNIFKFGQDATQYEDGEVVGHEDSWRAGQDGALPGLMMPGFLLVGSRYFQEQAPGVSMDCAEIVTLDMTYETPLRVFDGCIVVRETTPLEPDEEVLKVYAPNVGLIADGGLVLVEHHN